MIRLRLFIFLSSAFSIAHVHAQTRTHTFGVFTGFTSTYALDEGIAADPRYKGRYNIKFAPVALHYGIDYEDYGFFISAGLLHAGQDFYVVNTSGGQVGLREIDQRYLTLPVAFKLHLIDLEFFKLGAIAGAGAGFVLDASETISHDAARLWFPAEVQPLLPAGYEVVFDGVQTPKVSNYPMLEKSDHRPTQLFALLGIRADWDATESWRFSFDVRVNYGVFDPRTDEYIRKLDNHQTLYDLPGRRRELFTQFSVGVMRYWDVERKDNEGHRKKKGTPQRKPGRNPWPGPRKGRPRG